MNFFLAFLTLLATSLGADVIRVDTRFRVGRTDVYRSPNGYHYVFAGQDLNTGKVYQTTIAISGDHYVPSPVREMVMQNSPDSPSFRWQPSPNTVSRDVQDRFALELQGYVDKQRANPNGAVMPGAPERAEPKKKKEQGRAPVAREPSLGLGPVVSAPSKEGEGDRARAREMPNRIGATLDAMNWDMRGHRDMQEVQNEAARQHNRMIDADLAGRLESLGVQDASIKANMLLDLNDYLEGQKASDSDAGKGTVVLERIELTEEGRQALRDQIPKLAAEHKYQELANAVTLLANPWSGDVSDPALANVADRAGILKGPAFKENGLQLEGRESMKHRLRQAANKLQADVLQSDLWKSSRYLRGVVTNGGLAIATAATLEKWGQREDAEKLLYFGEAASDFLNGVDDGMLIGVIQTGAGFAELAITGYEGLEFAATRPGEVLDGMMSVAEFFSDPAAMKDAGNAIVDTIRRQAPVLAREAWGYVLDKSMNASASEKGRIVGRAVFEVGMFALGAGPAKVAAEGPMAARALEGGQELAAVVAKVDQIGERARYWKAAGSMEGEFVTKLPDLASDIKYKSFAESFEHHVFQGDLLPGDVVYQSQRALQTTPGDFFIAVRPVDSATGEAFSNIAKWNNHGEKMVGYVVKERVTVYAGPIAGGEGHQIAFPMRKFFPDRPSPMDFLEKVEEIPLPFKTRGEL